MKTGSKKLLSTLLAAAIVISLFAAMPLIASAEDGPIRVTVNPVGAIYVLNQTAVPIKATFYFSGIETEQPDWETPIKVQWYWSTSNSNTDRSNGLGENTYDDWYTRPFEHQTTVTPATDTAGVRYYYAVLKYSVRPVVGAVLDLERETVTEPARIEVIAPEPPAEHEFRVRKVDEDGNPLAGAVLSLVPDTEHTWGEQQSYEQTTWADGYATFSVTEGAYILSEEKAPAGYNATDDTYIIWVQDDQILEVIDYKTQNFEPYTVITFVNKSIPRLNADDHFAYMQGYPEGDFRPERNMTRAEAVVMFSRLLMESMDTTVNYRNDAYPDVPPTEWYANQVGYMEDNNVLVDYCRDGKFRPNDPVTRAEFATLASHFDELTLTDANIFSDVANDHWAVKYINSAAAKGWIVGYVNGTDRTFRPEGNITRAEVVTLVNRMLNRTADQAYLTSNADTLPRTFSDLLTGFWAYWDIMEASTGHDYIKDTTGEHWTGVYK